MRFFASAAGLALPPLIVGAWASGLLAQAPDPPRVTETAFELEGEAVMRYAISVPAQYDGSLQNPRPLILALHPGGRSVYYGSWFMQSIVEPALRGWEAVIVAPDVPDRSWSSPTSERAVLDLLEDVRAEYRIDPARILVTGFSMGGRGTWYLATRHSDLFTGAIVMAGSRGEESLDGLGGMPIYLIHSPDDDVVPYGPVEETAQLLVARGHPMQMLRLDGASHYMMGAYVGPLRSAGEWMKEQWQGANAETR